VLVEAEGVYYDINTEYTDQVVNVQLGSSLLICNCLSLHISPFPTTAAAECVASVIS
jgi:hypothetical protein